MSNSNATQGLDAMAPLQNDPHTRLATYSNNQLLRPDSAHTLPRYSALFALRQSFRESANFLRLTTFQNMANNHTSHRDSMASFTTLPRYSMLESIPMDDSATDATPIIPQLEVSESEPLDLTVLPYHSNGIRPTSISPRYTTVFGSQGEGSSGSSTIVPSSTSRPPKEHNFHLKNGKKAWATLSVLSSAPSSTNAPKFYGGDCISGSFSLDLDSSQYIQGIKLSVQGRIITSQGEDGSFTFLDQSATLWSNTMGDPQLPELSGDKKFDGWLSGRYCWPFSFKFPTQTTLSSGGPTAPHHAFQMPQTFTEKETSATIQYDLILCVSRGKLRADQRIQTPIVYVPKIVPDPPSIPRQLAYRDNSPLPGPGSDPDGWFTLPPTVFHGDMYGRHHIRVECSLSLANPLCYTRGTVIPCSLTIKCADSQALDLLSSPNVVKACLQRRIRYFPNNMRQAAKRRGSSSAIQYDVEEIQITTAKWWSPAKDSLLEGDERRVEGEIHLSRGLQPTSDFAHFIVEYSVDLLKFNCLVFNQTEPDVILASQPITIATFLVPGPTPKAYTVRPTSASRGSTFEKVEILNLSKIGGV